MIVKQILEIESGIVRASNLINSHHAICLEDHTKRCQVSRATLRVEDDGTLAPKSQLLRISQSRSVPFLLFSISPFPCSQVSPREEHGTGLRYVILPSWSVSSLDADCGTQHLVWNESSLWIVTWQRWTRRWDSKECRQLPKLREHCFKPSPELTQRKYA